MAYTELLVIWRGGTGLPGYSKFRFIGELTGAQLNAAAANLQTFLTVVRANIPSTVTLEMQSGVSVHADDGTLTAEGSIGTLPPPLAGAAAAGYSAASGFMVLWNTGAINGGKKVRGRTYFVPVTIGMFQNDGTIVDSTRTTLLAAANAFATSVPSPAVNSRARPSNPAAGNQTTAIISAAIPDKQVVLRSRRD
jgi:hypothetical protein